MSETRDFLFEIGTEELPPKHLAAISAALTHNLEKNFKHHGLSHGAIQSYATPRRLAVLVQDLSTKQSDQLVEMRGPATKIAYDAAGALTIAAKKFAASCGAAEDKLEKLETEKGSWVVCRVKKIGTDTTKLLPEIVTQALKNLPVGRQMRWGEGKITFIRPVHWVVLLFGAETIPAEILGVTASNLTYGHRFLHPAAITINEPKQYAGLLEKEGKVIADFNLRLQKIREQVVAIATIGTPLIDADLLDEVTGLVEWPVAMLGTFDAHFLEIPQEVLITSLQHQQRYFPIVAADGKLLPHFVIISNIESSDPKRVVVGNERVIRARLTDAEFFYRTDLQFTLDSYLERLKLTVFQDKLGSVFDKTQRLYRLADYLARELHADTTQAYRAALLSKCDLMSTMVWEFPELQGIMGYYYALQQFEPDPIALAIKEQYLPRYANDQIPTSDIGCILALADRVDTLVGLFGINKLPTGDKDPLGLRRAAHGILRIILERNLPLDLRALLETTKLNYQVPLENQNTSKQVVDFVYERMRAWYLDHNGNANVFNAVLAREPAKPLDFKARLDAVAFFITLPEAEALAAAHKRVNNILTKAQLDPETKFNLKLAKEPAEEALAQQLIEKAPKIQTLCAASKYKEALTVLAELKPLIDTFFEKVMVMVDKEKLRANRLALLRDLRELFISIADISLL